MQSRGWPLCQPRHAASRVVQCACANIAKERPAHGCVLASVRPAQQRENSTGALGGQMEAEWGRGGGGRMGQWAAWPWEGAGDRIWHVGWILTPAPGLVSPNLGHSELCQRFPPELCRS